MRVHVPCALSVVFLVCGCFGPKLDPGAPAPNYNPAAQRDDYPEPKGSASRPRSADANATPATAGDNRRALPQGSGQILKDFQRLTPERLRKVYEENDAWQRNDRSQEASQAGDAEPAGRSSDVPEKEPAGPEGASPPETPE